ncbi:MAG: 4Fe-4S binding protein [Treponema sp.]
MGKSSKQKTLNKKRHYIQALGFIVTNAHMRGFFNGELYQGSIKKMCFPVLNCYSCPGAISGCPIGSIQATINSSRMKPPYKFHLPYYVVGLTALFAIAMGRFYCGYVCPFGFYQDLLDKIPVKKIKVPHKLDNVLRWMKFVFLGVAVFLLPFFVPYFFLGKYAYPFFCKYVCPQGVLVGAIPHIIYDYFMRDAESRQILPLLRYLFLNKFAIFIIISIACMFIYRLFCRYICPLGAFLGLFNPISIYRFKINDKCIHCNKCQKACKMNIPVFRVPNSFDCIRCDECIKACPVNAIEKEYPFSTFVNNSAIFKKANFKKKEITKIDLHNIKK